ncbi:lipoprotein LpqH [Mycobacterium bourgelatii]|uniref:Putative lipoprotein LppE n=1 Tax=Mycobacterium bourgelatii TaxID=1273442 RepID=A0A7I9YQ05_MYCBU|nr:lipoprotein LpqH [Mycobacterium bourgelatii]MCV6976134.1 lipoprotein LpqH [Mycobacterium bourgelatii]GFG90760.1 putative lipoprotein LppE [Mycobacterium bourgelatii]
MRNRLVTVAGTALLVVVGVSACGSEMTVPRNAARVTVDGVTHTARPPACSQITSYRTIDIRDHDGDIQAVVLISGQRVIPQFVKLRNVDGFNGSAWEGGVGEMEAKYANGEYTISGSAYGINSKNNPNKVVNTDFKIVAEC